MTYLFKSAHLKRWLAFWAYLYNFYTLSCLALQYHFRIAERSRLNKLRAQTKARKGLSLSGMKMICRRRRELSRFIMAPAVHASELSRHCYCLLSYIPIWQSPLVLPSTHFKSRTYQSHSAPRTSVQYRSPPIDPGFRHMPKEPHLIKLVTAKHSQQIMEAFVIP